MTRPVWLVSDPMMKLSVIVPVYKVEPYLRKCVDSLLQQDLADDEYEIILVDDGSPDGCGAICDDYAAQHAHVKVVHRPNGGLSAARNSGIEVAMGDYVIFVDSDDFVEPNVLKALVDRTIAEDLDVLRFDYRNVNESYEVFEPNKESKPFVDYRGEVCDGPTFLVERLGFGCYAWQFVVRRELLDRCHFTEGICFEDTDWTPRLLLQAKRITSTKLLVYNYLHRQGSITQSIDLSKRRKALEDRLRLVDVMKKLMSSLADKRWFEGMIAQLSLSILNDVSTFFYGERRVFVRELKMKGVLPLSDFHSTQSAQRKIKWVNVSPELYCILMRFKTHR